MSRGLDPDQAWHYVGPDMGLNCLQRISSSDKKVTTSKDRIFRVIYTNVLLLFCSVINRIRFVAVRVSNAFLLEILIKFLR